MIVALLVLIMLSAMASRNFRSTRSMSGAWR